MAKDPFGTSAPNQVLCIESRPLLTRKDGMVWIYLAMDAHSRFAFHHVIKAQSILPEYVLFIMEVLKKHPELNKAKLAVDSRSDTISMFKKVFPDLSEVICSKAKVNEVTEEFHVAFLAHMGLAGRSN